MHMYDTSAFFLCQVFKNNLEWNLTLNRLLGGIISTDLQVIIRRWGFGHLLVGVSHGAAFYLTGAQLNHSYSLPSV